MPLCRKHSTKPRTKKRRIVLPGSSMSVASAEGSHWETAVAILMLRHEMMTKPLNCPGTKKIGALRELRDLEIYSETIKRSSCQNARSARRRMTMRRPQKNGGTEVETFFLGVARDARCDQRRQEKPGPAKGGRLAVSGKNFWRP